MRHVLLLMLLWFLYFPVMESLFGYTAGKGLFDLKVVMEDSRKKVSFWRAWVRHMFDFLDAMLIIGIVVITIWKSPYPRRIGDFMADTIVIPEEELTEAPVVSQQSESTLATVREEEQKDGIKTVEQPDVIKKISRN